MFENSDLRLETHSADNAEEVDFQKGEWNFREGDVGDALYILIDGEVSITLNADEVNVMGPMDSFGEIALLDDGIRTAGARAKDDVHALRIAKQTFEALVEVSPTLRLGIIRELSNILKAINERTEKLEDQLDAPVTCPRERDYTS